MARPARSNADYFSHDADMRNNIKVKAIRRKFGLEGYAIWNMILETLTDRDNYELPFSDLDVELLAGDYGCEPDTLKDVVEYCVTLGMLQRTQDGRIYSESHKGRFALLSEKRERRRQRVEEAPSEEPSAGEDEAGFWQRETPENAPNSGFWQRETPENAPNSGFWQRETPENAPNSGFWQRETHKLNKTKLKEKDYYTANAVCGSGEPPHDQTGNSPPVDYGWVVEFFNAETAGALGFIKPPLNEKRKGHVRARIREHGIEAFKEAIRKAARSDFLKGQGRKGWRANFDWIIKPTNFQKLIEGNYDNGRDIGINGAGEGGYDAEAFDTCLDAGIALAQYQLQQQGGG